MGNNYYCTGTRDNNNSSIARPETDGWMYTSIINCIRFKLYMYLFDQFVHFCLQVFLEPFETLDRGAQRFLVHHSDGFEHVHGQLFNSVLEPNDPFEMSVVLKITVSITLRFRSKTRHRPRDKWHIIVPAVLYLLYNCIKRVPSTIMPYNYNNILYGTALYMYIYVYVYIGYMYVHCARMRIK